VKSVKNEKALFDEVSKVVSRPVKSSDDFWDISFVLHAPLELCARYFLLPLVKDEYRSDALQQMENIRNRFEKFEQIKDDRGRKVLSFETDFGKWSTSFAYAGHATILAALAKRIGETNEDITDVLETMNSTLSEPDVARFSWAKLSKDELLSVANEVPVDRSNISSWFISNVANVAKSKGNTETIAGVVRAAEKSELIAPLVKSWIEIDIDPFDMLHHVYPLMLRIAALSMIIEDESESKYGWTHCLTIPHSQWVLADNPDIQKELFCSSLTYVASFRSTSGEVEITAEDFNKYFNEDEEAVFTSHYEMFTDIISRASVLEDVHLVKYVYSCFDIAKRDPHYAQLYLTAALALLKQWEV